MNPTKNTHLSDNLCEIIHVIVAFDDYFLYLLDF